MKDVIRSEKHISTIQFRTLKMELELDAKICMEGSDAIYWLCMLLVMVRTQHEVTL